MDLDWNSTYVITIDGYVALEKYRYLYFVIMFTVYILILCCNLTIIFIIWVQKSLHEPMYIFIAALLLNSLLFSTVIYPKLLIDFLSEKQTISYSACLFQYFMFYSLCGSDVLLLLVMACDRYVSICKPLHYSVIMGKTTVSVSLVVAWVLPAGHIAAATILHLSNKICNFSLVGIFCNSSAKYFYCGSSKKIATYGVALLFIIIILPVFFIFFTYARILCVVYQGNREVRKKAAQTCLPHLFVLISFSCLCSFDVIIAGLGLTFPKSVHFIMTVQMIIYHPLFNPIIYGLKMKEIFKHLEKLFYRVKSVFINLSFLGSSLNDKQQTVTSVFIMQ